MGVAVSGWRLANAVSRTGQLGVVSGTVLDTVMVRRLQDGDAGGHVRRALEHFPIPGAASEILRRYLLPTGRSPGTPYKLLPMYKQAVSVARQRVTMAANFVEVWLAKEGHSGQVGVNLLTKVQLPNLASLYGAMLAGVDFVIMGAGIPREIPGALDALSQHRPAQLRFEVEGARNEQQPVFVTFDPADHGPPALPLRRPAFLAVVSANSLALTLARKSNGRVDGFIVEGPRAGGHNAPPRGEPRFNAGGEPLYGERDAVDLAKMRELGLPFWLAGGAGSPEGLRQALRDGAAGIQVGTLFALCDESGLEPSIRADLLKRTIASELSVFTDPRASPTGYPFKVVQANGDTAEPRTRICDLGYLRVAVREDGGRLVYRCPAEPVADYVRKGGREEDTVGRRCLCNGLTAAVGLAQIRANGAEQPIVTSGDDLVRLGSIIAGGGEVRAEKVVRYLLG